MRHLIKKTKFKSGQDANQMLVRKLVVNFLTHGKLSTTNKKAKVLKQYIETLVEKTKDKKESNKNFLLRYKFSAKTTDFLFNTVGPAFKDKQGGYVRLQKIGQRESDGSLITKVEWVIPLQVEITKPVVPQTKLAEVETDKPQASEKKTTKKAQTKKV